MSGKSRRPTKRRRGQNDKNGPLDLSEKVSNAESSGFALEADMMEHRTSSGVYGDRSSASRFTNTPRANRTFAPPSSRRSARKKAQSSGASAASSRSRVRSSSHRIRSSTGSIHTAATSKLVNTPRPAVHIVCAVGENLARETCVASMDAGTPITLQVTKQGNGQTYAETLAYLEMLKPHEVILNEGRKNSPLATKILKLYEDPARQPEGPAGIQDHQDQTVVKFISRNCFDQTKGAELLSKLARTETFDPTLVNEYILLSSAHAVLHYLQQTLGASIARKCLEVSVNSGGKNRMSIDRATLLQLELLINAKTGKTRDSLVSTIDCTKTTVGTRLLRTTLMAPPSRSDTINARLDLVDAFLQDEDFFYSVLDHLKNLPAVDKMLTDVAIVPKVQKAQVENISAAVRRASKGISALVCIKTTLSALPALAGVIQDHLTDLEADPGGDDASTAVTGRSSLLVGLGSGPASVTRPHEQYLLRAILQALSQPQLSEVRASVSDVFTESTAFSRNANMMRHQECFALKSGDNGLMDIIRKAFLANVDDIYKKADEYAETHGMHVTVRYTTLRGYYLSVPADRAADLPNVFIQPMKTGRHIYCTTEEVHSLNIRAQDNVEDLLLMTHDLIQEVFEEARSKYDALAAMSDAIALLDLCHSFADKVTLSKQPWSRPVLVGDQADGTENRWDDGGILIRNGRYGIDVSDSFLASSSGPSQIIPNDTYASASKHLTVISGINGSGKSTYLKQVAIIVLLAHCGSYVPAEQASIPLRNRLCARMGTADDQEHNISSFMLEMKETAFICSNVSEKSLVLLDELGRATSNEDGVAIAWAVCEHLIKKRAMTFFVTHYPQLCQLSKMYPSVQNQHLGASISTGDCGAISYTHKLTNGPCTTSSDYGVEMTTSCGWPETVVDDARQIKASLRDDHSNNTVCNHVNDDVDNAASRNLYLKKLTKTLSGLAQNDESLSILRDHLQRLRLAVANNEEQTEADIQEYLKRRIPAEE